MISLLTLFLMLDNFEMYAELSSELDSSDRYANIGNLLRNRRLDMGISIESVANDLKLSAYYIQMLENGDYKSLSQKIYYFGYIRNIARYLKLDDEVILRYLVSEVKVDHDRVNSVKSLDEINILTLSVLNHSKNSNSRKSLLVYGVTCLIIVASISAFFIARNQSNLKDNPSLLMLKNQTLRLE